jgi:hypothetical protein
MTCTTSPVEIQRQRYSAELAAYTLRQFNALQETLEAADREQKSSKHSSPSSSPNRSGWYRITSSTQSMFDTIAHSLFPSTLFTFASGKQAEYSRKSKRSGRVNGASQSNSINHSHAITA